MASVTGGQFYVTAGKQTVILGINNGVNPPFPQPVSGDLNIEVFTSPTITTLPPLDTINGVAYNQGIIDHGGTINSSGFLTGKSVTLFGGAYELVDDTVTAGTPALIQMGSGNQTVIGAGGDTVLAGSGNQQINASLQGADGAESIVGGTGNVTIFGGKGDTITGVDTVSATAYIDGSAGAELINSGPAGTDTIFGSSTVSGTVADTIISAGTAIVSIAALGNGDSVDLSGGTGVATVNAAIGKGTGETILLGGGAATVFLGSGNTLTFGSVGQYADGTGGNDSIVAGSAGTDTIIGSTVAGSNDTFSGGGADVSIQGLGNGDVVNFKKESGNSTINASAGNVSITGGSGGMTVFGGSGDTVSLGTGSGYVDGRAGKMDISVGSKGTDTVFGDSVAGAGDTIHGGKGALQYDLVLGGDSIDLGNSTGTATINAFSTSATTKGFNDTVIGSQGSDSVWGGDGDRIGVANVHVANTTSNSHLWSHGADTTTGGTVSFGTNDTVVSTSYDTVGKTFTINTTTGSNAFVTIGGVAGSSIGDFQVQTDRLFYQGESATTNSAIVATAQATTIGGTASSIVALPDGTTVTLIGVTPTQLTTANTAGKLFTP